MRVFIRILTLVSLMLLLNACTSLEDFQKMTPETRAYKACKNDVTVSFYRSKIYQLERDIEEIDSLLLRGYKTHKNCTVITYKDNFKTNKEKPNKSIKKICTEVAIPLNDYIYEFEKNRRDSLTIELENFQNNKQINFDKCFNQVLSMTVEQAYNYYDN